MSKLGVPCWTRDNANDVLVNEALASSDHVFLATHTPLDHFSVHGSHGVELRERNEEALLETLAAPSRSHAFCVVEGAPGSGKSHLIRWLDLNWPNDADLRLLIQRSNGSLAGALDQLKARLVGYEHLFEGLAAPQAASIEGRASLFLASLGSMLEPNHYNTPPPDRDWCRQWDPGSLLLNAYVRQTWRGPERILRLLDGGGERNSQSARFNLVDVADLADQTHSVHDSVASEKLAGRLRRESAEIRDLVAQGCPPDEVSDEIGEKTPISLQLMRSLNLRINDAIRSVLGMSPDAMERLFKGVRRALGDEGRRIVLLLEDITAMQGVDDALLDALVTDANTVRDDKLCPLISVVGVTPEYLRDVKDNYRQRITHHVNLGESGIDAGPLATSSARAEFAARYLNAVRVGVTSLERWGNEVPGTTPPNACANCPSKAPCHEAFGDVDGVGLFPFTHKALDALFESLRNDGQARYRTPRGMLQGVLNPTLLAPDYLTRRLYPSPHIETDALERRPLGLAMRARIEAVAPDHKNAERLRVLLSFWGDRDPRTVHTSDGQEAYGGVSRPIIEAFSLPWPGDEETKPDVRDAPTDPRRTSEPMPASAGAAFDAATAAAAQAATSERRDSNPPPRRTSRFRRPPRGDLEQLRHDSAAFRQGVDVTDISKWHERLYAALQLLTPQRVNTDRFTFNKFFTPATVKIGDEADFNRSAYFVVAHTPWLAEGLEAIAHLRFSDSLPPADLQMYRFKAASLIRRLEPLAREHITRRLLIEDTEWRPAAAAVQVLLARAWLQGRTSAQEPLYDQWRIILSDEEGAESDPQSRTAPWARLLEGTNANHATIREALREMVNLPQGDAQWGVLDVSVAAQAIYNLSRLWRFEPLLPEEAPTFGRGQALQYIRQYQATMHENLPQTPHAEQTLINDRLRDLEARLHGSGVLHRLDLIDKEIARCLEFVPNAAANEVAEWKRGLARIRNGPGLGDQLTALEALIHALHEQEEPSQPLTPPLLLATLAKTPAKTLQQALATLASGEAVIRTMTSVLENIVGQNAGALDVDTVRAHGRAYSQAAQSAQAFLREPPHE